ncbi:MAG TPA: hypothetical protein VLR49_05555 [Ferruginibacter sp.]|nr:hypothetical protein [Ferruginibacter sp.]
MSISEMKKSIQEKIETLNEVQLKEVEIFINRINNIPAGEWDLEEDVKNIVEEREELLKKLGK